MSVCKARPSLCNQVLQGWKADIGHSLPFSSNHFASAPQKYGDSLINKQGALEILPVIGSFTSLLHKQS